MQQKSIYKVLAVIVFFGGVYTTYNLLQALVGPGESPFWSTIAGAILLQLILTLLQSSIWAGKATWVNWTALAVDCFTNIGGVYVIVSRLDQTESYRAVAAGLGAGGDGMSGFAVLAISVLFGVIMAAAPEALWRQQ